MIGIGTTAFIATQVGAQVSALSARGPAAKPVAITGRRARIVLYGDSLGWEARSPFVMSLSSGGRADVTTKTYGGTAICDWFPDMTKNLRHLRPDAVVIEFSGNSITRCMQDRAGKGLSGTAWSAKYHGDLQRAVNLIRATGARIYVVGTPTTRTPRAASLAPVFKAVVSHTPTAQYVDAGAAVLDQGRYTDTLPCLPFEGAAQGCFGGRVAVRAPDGGHFCPGAQAAVLGVTESCGVWSSGAWRFGTAMAAPVVSDFGLNPRV
jgi:hypothetical protein